MIKKRKAAVLAAVLIITLIFGGCGKKGSADDGTEGENASATAGESGNESPAETADAAAGETEVSSDEENESYEETEDAVSILVPEETASVFEAQGKKFAAKSDGENTRIRVLTYDGYSDLTEILGEKDADLFVFEGDQLPDLVRTGLIDAVSSEGEAVLKDSTEPKALEAARIGEVLYAWPLAIDNAAILYYDSGVLSDPSDLTEVLEDCEEAGKSFYMEMDSGWYQASFFLGAGCRFSYEMDDSGQYTGCTMDYASEGGLKALRAMLEVADSESFVNASEAGNASDIGALIGNVLDAPLMKDKLGDAYACMKLPKFRSADGTAVQMSGYISYRMLGMKEIDDPAKAAAAEAFAEYLTSKEAELLGYREMGWIPAASKALRSELVQSDEAPAALTDQMQYDEMLLRAPAEYWGIATGFGDEIKIGAIAAQMDDDTLLEVLKSFEEDCAGCAD